MPDSDPPIRPEVRLPDRPLTYALHMKSVEPKLRAFRIWCDTGMSAYRFFQMINALMDDPKACAAEPVACNRLRRIRHRNRVARGTIPPDEAP